MSTQVLFIQSGQTASDAARLFREHKNIPAFAVLNDHQKLVGFISRTNLIEFLAEGYSPHIELGTVIDSDYEAVQADDYLTDVFNREFEYIPVFGDGALVGILYYQDVYHALAARLYGEKMEIESSIDAVYNPVISVDNDLQIKIFNRSAAKLLNLEAGQVRMSNAREALGGTGILESLISGPQLPLPSNKLIISNRSFLPYRTNIVRDGVIIGSILVLREISEFEELVRESKYTKKLNRELDAVIESSFDGLYVTDGQA